MRFGEIEKKKQAGKRVDLSSKRKPVRERGENGYECASVSRGPKLRGNRERERKKKKKKKKKKTRVEEEKTQGSKNTGVGMGEELRN